MPTYYDPLKYQELQRKAEEFYKDHVEAHLAPLESLSPLNLDSLLDTSPVKVIKFGTRAAKLYHKFITNPVRVDVYKHKLGKQKKTADEQNLDIKGVRVKRDKVKTKHTDGKANFENLKSQEDIFTSEDQTHRNLKDREGNIILDEYLSNHDSVGQLNKQSDLHGARKNANLIYIYVHSTISSMLSPYLIVPYIPSQVAITNNSTFAKINILNRNNVPYQFINGSEEITFTINWYDPGHTLGDAYNKAKKMQLLTLMDGSKFPRPIQLVWGTDKSLFDGFEFYVKSASMVLKQFNTAKPSYQSPTSLKPGNFLLPARVDQEITLIRVDKPGYWTHATEYSKVKIDII